VGDNVGVVDVRNGDSVGGDRLAPLVSTSMDAGVPGMAEDAPVAAAAAAALAFSVLARSMSILCFFFDSTSCFLRLAYRSPHPLHKVLGPFSPRRHSGVSVVPHSAQKRGFLMGGRPLLFFGVEASSGWCIASSPEEPPTTSMEEWRDGLILAGMKVSVCPVLGTIEASGFSSMSSFLTSESIPTARISTLWISSKVNSLRWASDACLTSSSPLLSICAQW